MDRDSLPEYHNCFYSVYLEFAGNSISNHEIVCKNQYLPFVLVHLVLLSTA